MPTIDLEPSEYQAIDLGPAQPAEEPRRADFGTIELRILTFNEEMRRQAQAWHSVERALHRWRMWVVDEFSWVKSSDNGRKRRHHDHLLTPHIRNTRKPKRHERQQRT